MTSSPASDVAAREPSHRGVVRLADREARRQHDRRHQHAPLGDLVDPDQLAVPVEDVGPGVDGLAPRVALVREHGRHARPDRVGIPVGAARRGPMPHTDPAHVGDGVQDRRAPAADLDAQLRARIVPVSTDRAVVRYRAAIRRTSMPILTLGISFRRAPIELLERLSFADDDLVKAYRHALDVDAVDEAVILSTCNRVEIYRERPLVPRGVPGAEARADRDAWGGSRGAGRTALFPLGTGRSRPPVRRGRGTGLDGDRRDADPRAGSRGVANGRGRGSVGSRDALPVPRGRAGGPAGARRNLARRSAGRVRRARGRSGGGGAGRSPRPSASSWSAPAGWPGSR